jgi:predicted amidohydrolase
MSRSITVAAAQLGPIQMAEPRSVAVERMVRLMERAHRRGVELVVFPELALTTFFPRHYHENMRTIGLRPRCRRTKRRRCSRQPGNTASGSTWDMPR